MFSRLHSEIAIFQPGEERSWELVADVQLADQSEEQRETYINFLPKLRTLYDTLMREDVKAAINATED